MAPHDSAVKQRGRENKGAPDIAPKSFSKKGPKWCSVPSRNLDERQITHLICARLKYDLYDFFRGCFGPVSFLFLV